MGVEGQVLMLSRCEAGKYTRARQVITVKCTHAVYLAGRVCATVGSTFRLTYKETENLQY